MPKVRMDYIEIRVAKSGQFYWCQIDGDNHKVLCRGEEHPHKSDCVRAWEGVQAGIKESFDRVGTGLVVKDITTSSVRKEQ